MGARQRLEGKGEKQRRNTTYQKKKRRGKGVKPREEYLGKKEDTLAQLKEILATTTKPKWKEIAKKLRISDRHLRRLRQQM
ncbi:hypothetical protein CN404_29515 [Bacillus thuringiensis]|uniref:hypothetical protein n=1 Tax=Bacillus thuringiensis TaxID=1428 RepID=UPI000BF432B8|nr:hypothetical protein [Bacillus thuringiensis]PFB46421.1 hypothetical protein CN404_29515 [Bacillus thuringiensis]